MPLRWSHRRINYSGENSEDYLGDPEQQDFSAKSHDKGMAVLSRIFISSDPHLVSLYSASKLRMDFRFIGGRDVFTYSSQ